MKKINRPDIIRCLRIFILFLLISLIITGCISAHSDIKYGRNGPPAGRQVLRQIQDGLTSKSWLISLLGEPSEIFGTPDGSQILKYHYLKKVDNSLSIDPFFCVGEKKEERTIFYFEVRDGIVTNFCKINIPRGNFTLAFFDEQRTSSDRR